ncbi:hypothetical protein [Endozoicomonas sp. YOMI1]|uniref:hypothetical protein n=1 Tax=Endozoicomonas sp. YOMI1 TaxID=2828739 RepID=UPI00214865A5|nr:hypothetical protein [Endozoicomonas sp. YOMI1]
MKKRLIINITIMFWVIAAEVLVINASSKAQNQPLRSCPEITSTFLQTLPANRRPLPEKLEPLVLLRAAGGGKRAAAFSRSE